MVQDFWDFSVAFLFLVFLRQRDYTSHNELPTKSGKLHKIWANRAVIRVNWCLKKLFETFMSEIWWSGLQAFPKWVQNIPNKSYWLEFSTPAPKDHLPTLILWEKSNRGFGPPAITDTCTLKSYSFSISKTPFQVAGTDDSAKHLGDEKSPRNSERQRKHLWLDAGENFSCFDLLLAKFNQVEGPVAHGALSILHILDNNLRYAHNLAI